MEESQYPIMTQNSFAYIRNVLRYDKKSHFHLLCDDVINHMESIAMSGFYKELNRQPDLQDNTHIFWYNRGYDLPSLITINNLPFLDEFDLFDYLRKRPSVSITKTWMRDGKPFRENNLPYKITIGGRMEYANKFSADNIVYQSSRIMKATTVLFGFSVALGVSIYILDSPKILMIAGAVIATSLLM